MYDDGPAYRCSCQVCLVLMMIVVLGLTMLVLAVLIATDAPFH